MNWLNWGAPKPVTPIDKDAQRAQAEAMISEHANSYGQRMPIGYQLGGCLYRVAQVVFILACIIGTFLFWVWMI